MKFDTIFVGGFHGVGKTFFCNQLSKYLEVSHISASTLIKNVKGISDDGKKKVKNIKGNQDALINALSQFEPLSKRVLLDGHFCILDENGEIQPVAVDTFIQIYPIAIFVLTEDAKLIHERLNSRNNGLNLSLEKVITYQKEEINHAKEVCRALNLPFHLFKSDSSVEKAVQAIRNLPS